MTKLKFTKLKLTQESEDKGFWVVQEYGINTDKVKFETLGLIFIDDLGINWHISEEYSGIIELEELKQIVNFMEHLK